MFKMIYLLYTVYIPQVQSHRNSPDSSVSSRLQTHLPQVGVAQFLPIQLGLQGPSCLIPVVKWLLSKTNKDLLTT